MRTRVTSVRVVTTLEEFLTLSDWWNELLRGTASDNIFLTWEWLYTWSKHYLGANQLWTILVYKGENEIIGIAPLYIRKVKMSGGLSLREMMFLGTEEVCSSYLDFIVSEKNKREVLHKIYSHLHGEGRRAWDFLTLPEMPSESSSIDILDGFIQEAGKVMEIVGSTSCPVIELTGRLEDFLAGISGNERQNLRRKMKFLENLGNVSFHRAFSHQEVEKEMDAFVHLHQMRWEHKGPGGSFQSQRFLMFHREISQLISQKGWVHLDFLLLDGEKIAGIYGYVYNGKYSFYLPGFNPSIVPQVSPGKLLLFHCIEEAIREGCTQFDLLRGLANYKKAWANGLRRSLTLRHYNNHVRTAAFQLMESGKEMVKVLLR